MKRTLSLSLALLLVVTLAFAAPQVPYILYGHVESGDQMVSGSRVEIILNGVSNTVVTDNNGYWVYQLSSYSNGNTVEIRVLDGCSSGDSCMKSVVIGSAGFEDYAVVDFEVSIPESCPACNCGGGGGCSCTYTEYQCNKLFPPDDCVQNVCPTLFYDVEKCRTMFPCEAITCPTFPACPEPQSCEVCNECPDNNDSIAFIVGGVVAVLFGVAGLVLGGYTWYPGLKGLSNYYIQQGLELMKQGKYEEAKKKIDSGLKIMKTAVERAKSGEYNK